MRNKQDKQVRGVDYNSVPLVKLERVSKSFGGVKALDQVNFVVYPREIVGLIGDNGAGKSTLIKIIAGVLIREEGRLFIDGKEISHTSPKAVKELGVETVYQDLSLFDLLGVTENLYFGREITNKYGILNRRQMNTGVLNFLKKFGINISSVHQKIGTMSGGQRHSVAIGRAVYKTNPRLVILDEPTAGLGVDQSQSVLDLIYSLKENNISVIFISHNMNHILSICDRVVVLRSGRVVLMEHTKKITLDMLLTAMLGKKEGNDDGNEAPRIDSSNDHCVQRR